MEFRGPREGRQGAQIPQQIKSETKIRMETIKSRLADAMYLALLACGDFNTGRQTRSRIGSTEGRSKCRREEKNRRKKEKRK